MGPQTTVRRTTVPDPPAGYVLTVIVLPDPMAEAYGYARDGDYRLKLVLKRLLRDHGFRCVSVGPYPPLATTDTITTT